MWQRPPGRAPSYHFRVVSCNVLFCLGEIQSASSVQSVLHNDIAAVSAERLWTPADRFQYVKFCRSLVQLYCDKVFIIQQSTCV